MNDTSCTGQPFAPADRLADAAAHQDAPSGRPVALGGLRTQKDLLRLLRAGVSPRSIIERMDVPPSRLRRMLEGPRLKKQLDLEARLASAVTDHDVIAQLQQIVQRLRELAYSEKEETARKACTDLLSRAVSCLESTRSAPAEASAVLDFLVDQR